MTKPQEQKRKTYSLDPNRSFDLASHALNMTKEIGDGKNVPGQDILDVLVECLDDPVVYKKVVAKIKKRCLKK